jgi:hypothetical protein
VDEISALRVMLQEQDKKIKLLEAIIDEQQKKLERLKMPTPWVRADDVAFPWAPVAAHREEQQRRVKEIFGVTYPLAYESWQFLDTLLSYSEYGIKRHLEG